MYLVGLLHTNSNPVDTPSTSSNWQRLRKLWRNRTLNISIKVLIFVLLGWSIYQQVFAKENAADLWRLFVENFTPANLPWLLLVVVLVPVNWGLEALKWRQLIRSFLDFSFWKTYQAILAGVAIGVFTPNRIGEYGGRILMVEPEYNWRAFVATLVGNFSQFMVLVCFGLLGLIRFSSTFLDLEPYVLHILLFIGLCCVLLMLFAFLNIDLLVPIVKRLPFINFLKKHLQHLKVLTHYSSKQLVLTLLIASLRYMVYTLQYYLMLRFFGIDVPLLAGLSGIATIYLLQTSIPLPPLVGLLARGEVALYVWGFFSNAELNILSASFTLFIINLTIPALLGAVFIVKINVLKSLGYEKDKAD